VSEYSHYPEPLIPLIREWDRTWGLRTVRIDSLEKLAGTFGYADTVVLIAQGKDLLQVIQRWLHNDHEQARYLDDEYWKGRGDEGKYGLA
jgi:hypothetical protein